MAKHGLAADNLLGVELVTAAGEVLAVDASSHPDLFWGLRGGGGNFGVATSLTYRLHPVGMVTGGLIAHPIEAAPDLLRFYRDAVADASDDLTVFAGLVHAPDGSGVKLAALVVFHAGEPEAAERELAPFKAYGSPLVTEVGPMPYPVMNTLLDGGFPDGSRNYWLSNFTKGLPDALLDTVVERFASTPSPMTSVLIEHFHGAVTRVGPTETAVPHREPGWNLLVPSVWTDPARTEDNIRWTRDTVAALAPPPVGADLAQLPRRRPGRRRHPGRLRPQLRAAARDQAPLRPRQRLPPQPQHRPLSDRHGSPADVSVLTSSTPRP